MPRLVNSHQQLIEALRELRRNWAETDDRWRDRARREFESTYLDPLEPAVRSAANAILEVNKLLRQIVRECGSS